MTDAQRIKRYAERYFARSGNTEWPTVRQVSRGLHLSIRRVMDELDGYELVTSYYNVGDYDRVPDGDRFLEVL